MYYNNRLHNRLQQTAVPPISFTPPVRAPQVPPAPAPPGIFKTKNGSPDRVPVGAFCPDAFAAMSRECLILLYLKQFIKHVIRLRTIINNCYLSFAMRPYVRLPVLSPACTWHARRTYAYIVIVLLLLLLYSVA